MRPTLMTLIGCVSLLALSPAIVNAQTPPTETFQGWQGMRVIQQEGFPVRAISATLDSSKEAAGRQTLIVINTRQSRLEFYQWQPADKRTTPKPLDPERPNELPMAPEFKRIELPMDQLPTDAVVADIDDDGQPELVVLTGPAPRVAIYRQSADKPGGWAKSETFDLLPGQVGNSRKVILLRRPDPKGPYELLISFNDGIQTLNLKKAERPKWLTPRERKGRFWWDNADLRGTGAQDVVELPSQAGRSLIRWFPAKAGQLLPAVGLGDDPSNTIDLLKADGKPDQILTVDPKTPGILRKYKLSQGESTPIGDQLTLPLANGSTNNWAGVTIDQKPCIVWIDPDQPMLRVARLSSKGWESEESFPGITGMQSLVPMPTKEGVLILARDAAELMESHWENGRLTYPKPVTFSTATEGQNRKILALGKNANAVWWAQKSGDDLIIHRWAGGAEKPELETFEKAGEKADAVLAYAPGKLLLKEQYASGLKSLVKQPDGKILTQEPTHLSKAELNSYSTINVDGNDKLVRLTDGVLQWIGDDLQPTDQIMLGDGQKLSSYVPQTHADKNSSWALQQDGTFIHQMKPDKAGVPRITESFRINSGSSLVSDPVLGLLLIDTDKITRLASGPTAELALVDSFDARDTRPGGKNEPGFNRVSTARITSQKQDDIVLFNDIKNEITLLRTDDKGFVPVMTWQVYDTSSYPYGGGGFSDRGRGSTEPRSVTSFDADGDGLQDLALLCHDRLLIYLAREGK